MRTFIFSGNVCTEMIVKDDNVKSSQSDYGICLLLKQSCLSKENSQSTTGPASNVSKYIIKASIFHYFLPENKQRRTYPLCKVKYSVSLTDILTIYIDILYKQNM